jgi:hypothetical protein
MNHTEAKVSDIGTRFEVVRDSVNRNSWISNGALFLGQALFMFVIKKLGWI